ncbi:MAG: FHA domain-containing protein [Nannocystales bacterium]
MLTSVASRFVTDYARSNAVVMEALLRVISGPNVGACFVLEERTRVGRAADADIQLDEPYVSRHHARVRRQPDGSFELCDLGSTAGTTVNGAPVSKKTLQPDDVIAIGRSRFSFEMGAETSTAASFSKKERGFATLRPTVPMPVVPTASSPKPASTPVKRKRRPTTQRRIPAMRDAQPVVQRPKRPRSETAENLLDDILGPQTDVVVMRLQGAANEDSGPKVAASKVEPEPATSQAATPNAATHNAATPETAKPDAAERETVKRETAKPEAKKPGPSVAPSVGIVTPPRPRVQPVAPVERVKVQMPPGPRTQPIGVPRGVQLTESGALVTDCNPEEREAALSTLRDVLDYRALRLDGLRGRSMDARAKARYAQLTTRLLVETHGLPSSRRFVREPCPLPATLTQRDGALSRTLEVRLDDLSAGGTRLSMFDPSVRVGDEVWVAFDLAALFSFGQKVVFRSRVVWTSGRIGATGLMFGGNARFVDTVEAAIATG